MRPPIVRRSSGAPSRGQTAPRSPGLLEVARVRSAPLAQLVERRPRWRCSRRTSAGVQRPRRPGRVEPARHSVSSVSRLPRPARRGWSISRAFSGASLPAQDAAELGGGDRGGVGAEAVLVGVELDPAEAARVADAQSGPPSAKRSGEAVPAGSSRSRGVLELRRWRRRRRPEQPPVMPKRRPSVGPSSLVSSSSSLPRRPAATNVRAHERVGQPTWARQPALEVPGVGGVDRGDARARPTARRGAGGTARPRGARARRSRTAQRAATRSSAWRKSATRSSACSRPDRHADGARADAVGGQLLGQ